MPETRYIPRPYSYSADDDPAEIEDGPPEGSELRPLMETYAGQNFPYRGTETHGVNPLFTPEPLPEAWEGGIAIVDTTPREAEKVTPVRIVPNDPREFKEFRTFQTSAAPNGARMIMNRNDLRTKATIKNIGTARVWLSGEVSSCTPFTGYPLEPNAEFPIEIDTEVWALSSDANEQTLAIWIIVLVTAR